MVPSCCHCTQEISEGKTILELGTKQYCSTECLSSYCEERFETCTFCKVAVRSISKIKFCIRFGTQIEQFCSTSCIDNYKKGNSFCKLCHEPINSFMLISEEEKFCSPFCISRYNGKGINQLSFVNSNPCITCNVVDVHHLEMLRDVQSIFFCSKRCVAKYNEKYDTIKYVCSLCGCLLENYVISYYMNDKLHTFCSSQCSSILLSSESEIIPCAVCQIKKFSCDLINKRKMSNLKYYCSLPCLRNAGQDPSGNRNGQKSKFSRRSSSTRTSGESAVDLEADDVSEEDKKNTQQIVNAVLNKCYTRDILAKIIKSRFSVTEEDKCTQTSPEASSIETQTQFETFIDKGIQTDPLLQPVAVPFPVYIPKAVPCLSQCQATPMIIPIPIPVVIPIPLLKVKNEAMKKDNKLTFNEVAKQFILKSVAKGKECGISSNDPIAVAAPIKEPSDPVVDPTKEHDCGGMPSSDPVEAPSKTHEYGPSSSDPVATTSKDGDDACILLSSDSEDAPDHCVDCWSSDSDCMEIDSKEPGRSASAGLSGTAKSSAQSDAIFLSNLIKECDITKNTVKLRETLGMKIWNEFAERKSKSSEFRQKVSTREIQFDKLSNSDKCCYLVALLKDFTNKPGFEPRSFIYVILCLQKYFTSTSAVDSLFTNVFYQRFGNLFFIYLQTYMDEYYSRSAFFAFSKISNMVRIQEDMLWDASQLGSMAPNVLLFTMFYFNTKYFNLNTVEEHELVTFKRFTKYYDSHKMADGTPLNMKYLRYHYPKDMDPRKRTYQSIMGDLKNFYRCPVKINEFYISKCPPITMLTSNFYLTPVLGCNLDSKYWFTARSLSTQTLHNMFNLILMVEEIQNVLERNPECS